MKNNLFIELDVQQMQDINGGSRLSEALGLLWGTVESAAVATWNYIKAPKPGSDVLMNCI